MADYLHPLIATQRFFRNLQDKTIAIVSQITPGQGGTGVKLQELGGEDPQQATTYWHQRPQQAPRTWQCANENDMLLEWEEVKREWVPAYRR